MTDTLLVRLKPYDPRRGHVLRRYTYAGIKFQEERGWYRVERPVAEYLRAVREVPSDRYSPLAFDVCTEAEAKALDANESEVAKPHRFLGPTRKQAKAYVRRLAVIGEDGNAVVVRVVQYSPAETAARRAVIEAAERMAMRGARGDLIALIRAVGDLRAAERKEAGK